MARTSKSNESGRARAARLLRETRCECKQPAIVSRPKGHGKYEHYCISCGYGL
jgi:hypothetical protein